MASVETISLGYNRLHLVQDEGSTVLVDAGPDYAGAAAEVEAALAGRVPNAVVVTHGHADHAGLGRWWLDRGVPVLAGAGDATIMCEPGPHTEQELDRLEAYARTCGAPATVQAGAIAALMRRRQWARMVASPGGEYPPVSPPPRWPTGLGYRPFHPSCALTDGMRVGAGLVAIAVPGHTPGNFVLVHPAKGWLFSGDQLLREITPTPAIQLLPDADDAAWRYRSLPAFVAALRRLAGMELTRAFPGHGDPFDDASAVIRANLEMIDERANRLASALRAEGPCTVYHAAALLYPRAVARRFWQIISTVQGTLDLLEANGRVTFDGDLYRPAQPAISR